VWLALGSALYEKSTPVHTKEELEAYEKCVAILPRGGELSLWEATVSSNAYSNLGICRATQSPPDFEGAERALLKAVKLHPKSANAHYHLGLVYQELLCHTKLREVYFRAVVSEYQYAINLNHEKWSPLAQAELAHFGPR
jgi:tetratricopeptide (TPR) repeat protein